MSKTKSKPEAPAKQEAGGDCPSATCSLSEMREWVAYTKDRAARLHAEAAAWNPDTDTYRRLKTKAGCFRSLAIEVERIIKANANVEAPPESGAAKLKGETR